MVFVRSRRRTRLLRPRGEVIVVVVLSPVRVLDDRVEILGGFGQLLGQELGHRCGSRRPVSLSTRRRGKTVLSKEVIVVLSLTVSLSGAAGDCRRCANDGAPAVERPLPNKNNNNDNNKKKKDFKASTVYHPVLMCMPMYQTTSDSPRRYEIHRYACFVSFECPLCPIHSKQNKLPGISGTASRPFSNNQASSISIKHERAFAVHLFTRLDAVHAPSPLSKQDPIARKKPVNENKKKRYPRPLARPRFFSRVCGCGSSNTSQGILSISSRARRYLIASWSPPFLLISIQC